ncbi:MAG TPA: glycosyltransferase family 87 protein [bacterium]|nr:glycosyltransferase family 87 protein [bacterium]
MTDMRAEDQDTPGVVISRAWAVWLVTTACFLVINAVLLLAQGRQFFSNYIQAGPQSSTPLTMASVGLAWLSLGAALVVLKKPAFRKRYGFSTICGLAVALLYINLCRERPHWGDLNVYVQAATDLVAGNHFSRVYLYPPLLASLLEPLVRFGPMLVAAVFWVCNMLALIVFYALLVAALGRYGFSQRLSALVTMSFMVVNVPVMRTLFYGQVNLHVTNLMLIALVAYPGVPALSALALALAVHIKVSPIVLALPFIMAKDKKWIAWFVLFLAALAGITLVGHGTEPFRDFVTNITSVYSTTGINFRQNSVDSLVRSTALVLGVPVEKVLPVTLALKGVLLVLLLATVFVCAKRKSFRAEGPGAVVMNTTPALLLLMLIASPLIWEHHPVFVALTFLVIIRKLETPSEWVLYGFAYFLEYVVPTFDFFPWSFGRLLGALLVGLLLYRASGRGGAGPFVVKAERYLDLLDDAGLNHARRQP